MAAAAASASTATRNDYDLVDMAWAGEMKEYDMDVLNKAKVGRRDIKVGLRRFDPTLWPQPTVVCDA